MAKAKLFACYPHPTDAAAFERAYAEEHLPMAAPAFAAAGAQRVILTKTMPSPMGPAHFYRIAEIQFPAMDAMMAAMANPAVQKAIAHANAISTGGPVVAMFSGEDTTVDL